jgi:hypothetical protein
MPVQYWRIAISHCNRPWLHVIWVPFVTGCYFIHASRIYASAVAQFFQSKGALCRAMSLSSGMSGIGDRHRTGRGNGKEYDARRGLVNHIAAKRVICVWIY